MKRSSLARRLILALAPLSLSLSGCLPPQVQQVLATALPMIQAATAGGSFPSPGSYQQTSNYPTSGAGALTGGASTGTPSLGSYNPSIRGGLPTRDSYGPDPRKQEIGRLLDAAARRYGIPPDILKAVAHQESEWRAHATSFDGGHGKGVMQIDDRFHAFARTSAVWDPAKNIDYGARYLRGLYDETGSWEKALKRYNGGSSYPGKVFKVAQKKPWTQTA